MMMMKDVRTGRVCTESSLYMFACIVYETCKELFTSTYSARSTFKIVLCLAIVYAAVLVAAFSVQSLWTFVLTL